MEECYDDFGNVCAGGPIIYPGFFEDLFGFLTQPFFLAVYAFLIFMQVWDAAKHRQRMRQSKSDEDTKPATDL